MNVVLSFTYFFSGQPKPSGSVSSCPFSIVRMSNAIGIDFAAELDSCQQAFAQEFLLRVSWQVDLIVANVGLGKS